MTVHADALAQDLEEALELGRVAADVIDRGYLPAVLVRDDRPPRAPGRPVRSVTVQRRDEDQEGSEQGSVLLQRQS